MVDPTRELARDRAPARARVLRAPAGTMTAAAFLTVGELAAPHPISLAAASKHVRVLERAGLVRRTVHGRRHVCRLEPAPLAEATEHLRFFERFWNARLDALEAYVAPAHSPADPMEDP